MRFNRQSGILLHPTSLPSKYGVGDLGSEAFGFIDFLSRAKQKLWQILPLGPVGFGESPYQCFSAFAGNTMLISIDDLIEQGLLANDDIWDIPAFNSKKVDFEKVKNFKEKLFKKAYHNFQSNHSKRDYLNFIEVNNSWLREYAFFMALKKHFNGAAWNYWDKDIAFRQPQAIEKYRQLLKQDIEYQNFLQYTFFRQWFKLKKYANDNNIKIVGDLPIFISYDSSDAWAQPHLFELDQEGNPSKMAGVPPDYFSATGQLWGNPHYKWDEMAKDNYQWWQDRIKGLLTLVDIIRIDHFRGFEAYWEVPGGEVTAIKGRWVKAPGKELFTAIRQNLGELPIIAEDLGLITPEVEELKNMFQFPGMKILQFAFGGALEERFLPHNYENDSVVYTGTHDNDTTLGWYKKAKINEPSALENLAKYCAIDPSLEDEEICWKMIELALSSSSDICIIPLQDILCLDTDSRMNIPGTVGGNWEWRFERYILNQNIEERLAQLVQIHNRV